MGNSSNESVSDFKGQSAIVVGATGALGSALALRLADRGAGVTMSGANGEKLRELQDEVARREGKSNAVSLRPESERDAAEIVASDGQREATGQKAAERVELLLTGMN